MNNFRVCRKRQFVMQDLASHFGRSFENIDEHDHLMNTYAALPVAFERGEGAWLWDEEGKRYLDAISRAGSLRFGPCPPGSDPCDL